MGHSALKYDLAVEILNSRRLVKGYSDTHARGTSKFERVVSAVPMLAVRTDGAEWMRRLISSALKDEAGSDLDGALRTVRGLESNGLSTGITLPNSVFPAKAGTPLPTSGLAGPPPARG